jgi:ribonuclease T1
MRLLPLLLAASLGLLAAAPAAARGRAGDPADAPTVRPEQLPREARDTLLLIRRGGPFAYPQDGGVFGNREGRLPGRPPGYYREYTVRTPGAHDRGARRIIAGQDGDLWYTNDHYRHFRRILAP